MSKGIVLSLFDFTGNMVKPWADAGYLCYCVDMQHESEDGIREGNIGEGKSGHQRLPATPVSHENRFWFSAVHASRVFRCAPDAQH